MGYYTSAKNLHFLLIARVPTESSKNKDFVMSSLDTQYNFNYFPDYAGLSPLPLEISYKELFKLSDSWMYYFTNFKVINNFYFKFELNMDKIFNNNFFFKINPDREDHVVLNHIIKLSNSFIFKVFYVSKSSNSIMSIYRTTINYDKLSQNFAFIYEKSLNTMRIKIKSRKKSFKILITLNNFTFINFGFFMNESNRSALSSIYFSNIYTLHTGEGENNVLNKCSKYNFDHFYCVSKDVEFCQILYCKICCKKTISFEPFQAKCQANCINGLKNNLV